jgi:4-diphosphocytidyl-2-C-methyl-D-erythritol kinase
MMPGGNRMDEITLKAGAKINLTLDVLSRREDGYHLVEMVMQEIDLADNVHIALKPDTDEISICCNHPAVPAGENNIAYRAARLIKEAFGVKHGVAINIEKNIPVAAGLAGGSTDAAAVIRGLNEIWELDMETSGMMELGRRLGADVPFCILGGTALARGIGERLTPLRAKVPLHLLLVKPDAMVSTAWVYGNLNLNSIDKRPDTRQMIKAIEEGDIEGIARGMVNVLEKVTVSRYPEIRWIKRKMIATGALGAAMSGSGPTVIGIYGSSAEAVGASEAFIGDYREVMVTKTVIKNE